MPVAAFVLGEGSNSYFDTFSVSQFAVMKKLGANAVVFDPYFYCDTTHPTAVRGFMPHGFHISVTLTGTAAVRIWPTHTTALTNVHAAKQKATSPAGYPETLYSTATDYILTNTGRTIARRSGSSIPTGSTVLVSCDQFMRYVVRAAANAGLQVWLKPMLRATTTGSLTNATIVPGATKITAKTSTSSFVVTSSSFTAGMAGKRCMGQATANSTPTNHGKTAPTTNLTGAHDTTCWCYIKSVVAGTSATLSVKPASTHASTTLNVITDGTGATSAQHWFWDTGNATPTSPTRNSWLGVLTWLVAQCQAVGVNPAGIELATEQTRLTQWFEPQWRKVVAYLRMKCPTMQQGISTGGSTKGSFATYAPSHWWTVCDYLGKEAYSLTGTGSTAGTTTVAAIQARCATFINNAKTVSALLGTKPFIWTEVGFRAIAGGCTPSAAAGTNPLHSTSVTFVAHTYVTFEATSSIRPVQVTVWTSAGTTKYPSTTGGSATFTISATGRQIKRHGTRIPTGAAVVKFNYYSPTTQAKQVRAMLQACWGQPWWGGFVWWAWLQEGSGSTQLYSPVTATTENKAFATATGPTSFRAFLVQRASFFPLLAGR